MVRYVSSSEIFAKSFTYFEQKSNNGLSLAIVRLPAILQCEALQYVYYIITNKKQTQNKHIAFICIHKITLRNLTYLLCI